MHKVNWKRLKDGAVNIILALLILAGLGGYGESIYLSKQNNELAHTIVAQQAHADKVSARYHQANVTSQTEIKYLLGVVVFLTGEIHSTQMDNETTLAVIKTVQQQVADLAPIIEGLPTADSQLGSLATQLISSFGALASDVQAACSAAGISCQPLTLNAK